MAQPEEIVLPDALHIIPSSASNRAEGSLSTTAGQSDNQSAMRKIQELLLRGEKQKAYHYALDERLFAHALVIASGIDKEAFKEAVNDFVRSDLGVEAGAPTNGLESLRVAYSLFSGQPSMAGEYYTSSRRFITYRKSSAMSRTCEVITILFINGLPCE